MAAKAPPLLDDGYSPGDRLDVCALAPVGTILGIACIITGLRIYWRLHPTRRIGADDYTILFALALTIAWYGIDTAMYTYGRGLEGFKSDPWIMGPLVLADGILWVWALNVVRISVALMLLRFKRESLAWRLILWSIVGLQSIMVVVGTAMHIVMCLPVSAQWVPTATAKCIPTPNFMVYGYVYSGFTIASDFILSLLPITFIRSLRRPLHERVLIGCLMAAGIGATGVAIARLLLIMGYLGPGGPRINLRQDILWGLELTIGVLAASLPTLKAPVHRLLQSWGVLRSESGNDLTPQNFLDRVSNRPRNRLQAGRPWGSVVRELAPQIQGEAGSPYEKICHSNESDIAKVESAHAPGVVT